MSAKRPVPSDRVGPLRRLFPLYLATAASVGLAAQTVPTRGRTGVPGFVLGALAAAMAIYLLTSIPARWASSGVLTLGAALLVRFGELGGGAGAVGSVRVISWVVATGAALVAGWSLDLRSRSVPGFRRGIRWSRVGRSVVVVGSLAGAAALTLGPSLANAISTGVSAGDPADDSALERSTPLMSSQTLDMTQRPRLGNDVVMTVKAARRSFWRTGVFDVWDGRTWSRDRPDLSRVVGGRVQHEEDDLAATVGRPFRQEFRIEAKYSEVMPAAPSVVSIDSTVDVAQYADGSLVSPLQPLGPGATYTVTSRQVPVTTALLTSSSGPVPAVVTRRDASRPRTTERVRRLAESVTAGAPTAYAKVIALEDWLGANTRYSIDAPITPAGRDVVDHFLFDSKVGWCEQVASSLTVMLRQVGVPARLATGFVSGEWDPLLRAFRVRENQAHAWTEVWFAGVGWVPFDPTADVPLSGEAGSSSELGSWWWGSLGWILLGLAVVVAGAMPLLRALAAVLRRLRSAPTSLAAAMVEPAPAWVGSLEGRLERIGERAGRERAAHETMTGYGRALAPLLADERAATLGALLDRARYAAGAGEEDRQRAEQLAEQLAHREPLGVS